MKLVEAVAFEPVAILLQSETELYMQLGIPEKTKTEVFQSSKVSKRRGVVNPATPPRSTTVVCYPSKSGIEMGEFED